jgi:hypothetical protein
MQILQVGRSLDLKRSFGFFFDGFVLCKEKKNITKKLILWSIFSPLKQWFFNLGCGKFLKLRF